MKKLFSIAADLGASGGKMAKGCFTGETLEIDDYFDFPNHPVSLNGNLYWDLFGLYQKILQGMTYYAKQGNITSIGIDTWGASYGFLDNKGRLLEPVYHYRDLRTEKSLEKLYRIIPEKKIYQYTGCRSNRSYTLPQLFSYVEHEEPVLGLADRLMLLPDLLEYFLSGEISSERSIAGTSGLMRADQETWAWEMIEQLGIPAHLFGKITDSGRVAGTVLKEVADSTGTGKAKVISVCGHDTASAIIGIPSFGVGQVYISIGTNVNMGMELTHSIVNGKSWESGLKNAGLIGKRNIFYKDFSALWLLNELIRIWNSEGNNFSYDRIMQMSENCKSRRVYVDPEDPELNNPGGDIRRKINTCLKQSGQEKLESDGEFVRCIFESIALKIRRCTEQLIEVSGYDPERISIVNGGTRNHVLMQYISNALGRPVYAGMPYATLAGNLLTQIYSMNEASTVDDLREISGKSFRLKEYQPDLSEKDRWAEDLNAMVRKGLCR